MGKRKKRMTKGKYAKKYAIKRAALGFTDTKTENKLIEIDMVTGEDINEEAEVQVVVDTPKVEEFRESLPPDPEPQLQTVQVEEAKSKTPTRKRKSSTPKKTPTTPKKTTATKRKTTTRRKTTKKAPEK